MLRKYRHVQRIHGHLVATILELNVFQMDQTFKDYLLHISSKDTLGIFVETGWQTEPDYISWLYRVFHLMVLPPVERHLPRPLNMDPSNKAEE